MKEVPIKDLPCVPGGGNEPGQPSGDIGPYPQYPTIPGIPEPVTFPFPTKHVEL